MAKAIEIEIEGLDIIQKAFSQSPQIVTDEMSRAIMKSLLLMQGYARQNVPKDTSNLGGKIQPKMINALHGELVADTNYAVFVHEGTRPHFPPFYAIDPWARRHGIPTFLVQRAIARKGTKANPFMKDAKESANRDVSRIFNNAINNITSRLTQ